ncbi:tetratricopeptide repeat protein [Candidatus Dependentiae bacterium]|nr:tetratricopeptide repeat protein [Candidatus Dependentiae bacterium]
MIKYYLAVALGCATWAMALENNFLIHLNAGNEHMRSGNYQQAHHEYGQALDANPTSAITYFNQGIAYLCQNDTISALASFQHSVSLEPTYVKAHLQIGKIYQERNEYGHALTNLRNVLTIDPNNVDALERCGKIYMEQNNLAEALACFQQATTLCPHESSLAISYANALVANHRISEAFAKYQDLLQQFPHNETILYNIGYLYKRMGKIDTALHYYRKILENNPDHVEAHFGLAMSYLLTGSLLEGWKHYESRWHRGGLTPRTFKQPQWSGEPLQGKTLFIHAEQGLGDTLQFIRYAKLAKTAGATVVAAVHKPLVTLLSHCPYLDRVIPLGQRITTFDYHIPLMSMPLVYQTELNSIPTNIPYLYADEQLVQHWGEVLKKEQTFTIGICWQGNPNYSTASLRRAVAAKSIPLHLFAPLASIPGVRLYSLQRTSGTEQLTEINDLFELHTFDDSFDVKHGRFMDTAAVMKHLDLVITVDTATCHLAGGLGVPVWLMLPNPPDWRWMLERSDTPWYPTMQLFRQPESGDWESVINEITLMITQLIDLRKGLLPES